jgi:hypothetical protein
MHERRGRRKGLNMLSITHTMATQDQVWTAFRRTPDVRLRERSHSILPRMDGKNCLEGAQWLYRDEETIRAWVHAFNETGLRSLERATTSGRPT